MSKEPPKLIHKDGLILVMFFKSVVNTVTSTLGKPLNGQLYNPENQTQTNLAPVEQPYSMGQLNLKTESYYTRLVSLG